MFAKSRAVAGQAAVSVLWILSTGIHISLYFFIIYTLSMGLLMGQYVSIEALQVLVNIVSLLTQLKHTNEVSLKEI